MLFRVDAFRVQVTPRARPEDYSTPQRRSFVFFTTDDVESWITDVERAVKGSNEADIDAPSSKSAYSASGFSTSLHQAPSSTYAASNTTSTSYSTTTTSSRSSKPSSQRDFASYTDGDFEDTKVKFDSGMKLGGIRGNNNGGFDDSTVPTLAPPPVRTNVNGGGNAPLLAPPGGSSGASMVQHTANSSSAVPSLEDFLGLSIAPAPQQGASSASISQTAPQANNSTFGGFHSAAAPPQTATAPTQSNAAVYNPFGGPAPSSTSTAPAATNNASSAYMNAFYASQAQQQQQQMMQQMAQQSSQSSNPFMPATTSNATVAAPQSYNFGAPAQPNMQPNYYGGFGTMQPTSAPSAQQDPFASFGSPQPASAQSSTQQQSKPVDFFF